MSLTRQVLLLFLLLAQAAISCQICVPIPTRSAADIIIQAETVVLARENPDKPFSLLATETLKGELADPAVDLFLDTQSRRVLTLYPDREIICIHDPTDPEQPWQRIGITNSEVERLVRTIIELSPTWKDTPDARLAFFAPLLGHDDPFISTLAHLEVGNAPYASIRALGVTLPREHLLAFLDNFRMAEWHALYILILAQSENPEDHERIRQSIESAAKYSTTLQLPAWATALIEIDGERALNLLEAQYLSQSSRTEEEIRAILLSLTTHGGTGPGPLRERIISIYGKLLTQKPKLAPLFAADLEKWQRRDLVEPITSLLKSSPDIFDIPSTITLRSYLRSTTENSKATTKRKPTGLLIALCCLLLLPVLLKIGGSRRKQPER